MSPQNFVDSDDLALVWLRHDLRVHDNPALAYALRHHNAVLCLYIDTTDWQDPPATAWWLRAALIDLKAQLSGCLLYRQGDEETELTSVISHYPVKAVYWNRRYEPQARTLDARLKQQLRQQGLQVASFPGNLLFEPWEVSKADGSAYRVFTPFYKAALKQGLIEPHASIPSDELQRLLVQPEQPGDDISALPVKPWMEGFAAHWQPTRQGAEARLAAFTDGPMQGYDEGRNLPAQAFCSRLSPWLHHGQIGVREIVAQAIGKPGAEPFIRELIWREFAHAILYHWPETVDQPMDRRFEQVTWQQDDRALRAWQQGKTGIPLVDAGMRELWHSGFMHNRVRMVVASLLTKHLQIDWRAGARWFEYTLLDADLANNRMGWQWCAGSGVDAAPYFRIFNPVSQGQRFDSDGDYVRRWIPELAKLPAKWIHQPWAAPEPVLRQANVRLGQDYPHPIVDLKTGRERALGVWESIKGSL